MDPNNITEKTGAAGVGQDNDALLRGDFPCCKEHFYILQTYELFMEILPVIFHKLKNKLTPIMGYTQILQNKLDDESLKRRVTKIEKNADDLVEQLDTLSDYFIVPPPPRHKEDLGTVLGAMEPILQDMGREAGAEIRLDLEAVLPAFDMLPGQIRFLVTALVENGLTAINIKQGDKGGIVHIRTAVGEDGCLLSVKDNGVGIEAQNIARIWTPFFSLFPGRAGIGLTFCEKIIANHKGTYTVNSEYGSFTEFILHFPTPPG